MFTVGWKFIKDTRTFLDSIVLNLQTVFQVPFQLKISLFLDA